LADARPTLDALIAACGLPRLEARVLLEHACGRSREWLIAHGDEAAAPPAADRFRELARRRAAGEPLAYLVGGREFFGRLFIVGPDVLIPRPETELLASEALRRAAQGARVLDLGTGSGCIAVTLACERSDLRVVGTDRSARALALARANATSLAGDALSSGRLSLREGDWWRAVNAGERFELIVSNPPYIAGADPHLDAGDLRHEPRSALVAGADGLAALREIAAGAPARLASDGWLLVEHGWDQGAAVRELFRAAGLAQIDTLRDDEGRERITAGRGA